MISVILSVQFFFLKSGDITAGQMIKMLADDFTRLRFPFQCEQVI